MLILALSLSAGYAKDKEKPKEKKKFTFEDVMQFKNLLAPVVSWDGNWIGYYEKPDRGNCTAVVRSTSSDTLMYRFDKGTNVTLARNSQWAAVRILPDKLDLENKKGADKPKNGMALINLQSGKKESFENIDSYDFSNDSKWLAYRKAGDEKNSDKKKRPVGSPLYLRHLESGTEIALQSVTEFKFDSLSKNLAFIVEEKDAKQNAVCVVDLQSEIKFPKKVLQEKNVHFSSLSWNHVRNILAFVMAKERGSGAPDSCVLAVWNNNDKEFTELVNFGNMPKEWYIPFSNKLEWSKDGERLFFGFRPMIDTIPEDRDFKYADSNYYDIKTITSNANLDLWHWNDPMIKTHRKDFWQEYQNKTYLAVYYLKLKKFIQLADKNLPDVSVNDNPDYALGADPTPYYKDLTWDGDYADIYAVNLKTGERKPVRKKVQYDVHLSPMGKYIVYYIDKQWHVYTCAAGTSRCLTDNVPFPFYDEDWDVPAEPGSYGIAGWMENDEEVMIYTKYDIIRLSTAGQDWKNQTVGDGKTHKYKFRIVNLDPEKKFYKNDDYALIEGFSEKNKSQGLFKTEFNILGMILLADSSNYYYNLVAQSQGSKKVIFTKENYQTFPDLWMYDSLLNESSEPWKLTNLNSQLDEYYWGSSELIKWISFAGDTLDGYYIKPEKFDAKKKYPVVIYFYEQMSDGAKRFSQPANNHRPCYQVYNGDDYVIFLPDIKYRNGSPGKNALDALVSGSLALSSIGVADSSRIALWGHSWSGYQASFIITQTDFFKCVVAGAPVCNMTSAYGGIRLESGRARQFQYEKWQSRIGGNIWDSLNAYIKNSPIFFTKNANTPILIEFGDQDDAVPWQQGIEWYLALRRLSKPAFMLEYRDEPHIVRKYQNKLDYAVRQKEFYDYYLQGKTAPKWLTEGLEYRGQ